jgi:hypothetical protein
MTTCLAIFVLAAIGYVAVCFGIRENRKKSEMDRRRRDNAEEAAIKAAEQKKQQEWVAREKERQQQLEERFMVNDSDDGATLHWLFRELNSTRKQTELQRTARMKTSIGKPFRFGGFLEDVNESEVRLKTIVPKLPSDLRVTICYRPDSLRAQLLTYSRGDAIRVTAKLTSVYISPHAIEYDASLTFQLTSVQLVDHC